MSRIVIDRFRQINSLDISIKDIMVFIGPQASGKSTLCKLVYYFSRLPLNLILFIDSVLEDNQALSLNIIEDKMLEDFSSVFGVHDIDDTISITYFYDTSISIILQSVAGNIRVVFSEVFVVEFEALLQRISKFYESDSISSDHPDNTYSKVFNDVIRFGIKVFGTFSRYDYIPAGRMLVSLFRDLTWAYTRAELLNKDTIKLEKVVSEFYNTVSRTRNNRNDTTMRIEETADLDDYEEVFDKITRIMKGNVYYKKDGESVQYDNNHDVSINLASSGQQEVLWILIIMLEGILSNKNVKSIIVEEPEAHLFPHTQKELVEFMIMWHNITHSKLILTTHSPYILTVLNNLLLAHKTAKKHPIKVEKIIKEYYWVDYQQLGVYYLDCNSDEYAHDLLDNDLQMIDDGYIDAVSLDINKAFDELTGLLQ